MRITLLHIVIIICQRVVSKSLMFAYQGSCRVDTLAIDQRQEDLLTGQRNSTWASPCQIVPYVSHTQLLLYRSHTYSAVDVDRGSCSAQIRR